ncbi:MAG: NAD(+) diphosphatase [Sphingomonadaceae bacterium]
MIAFTGSHIDRADNLRADPEALAQMLNWRARLLALEGLMPAIDDDGALVWTTLADASDDAELVFLGLDDGRACFVAVPDKGDAGPRLANPAVWQAMTLLSPQDLAIYGGARSLVDWHARHRFCPNCGSGTKIAKGGWQRDCTDCGAPHFPRTDPVTIMLVEHDGDLLLGRGLNWPEGRYSTLAGFVEPGESIEEAVAREVLEETGVTVRDVSYVASQPWPFPSQLMLGCHGRADGRDITLDTTELADARWYSREEVRGALAGDGPFIAPPAEAIANHLLNWWIDR